jgi:hypothetical protein
VRAVAVADGDAAIVQLAHGHALLPGPLKLEMRHSRSMNSHGKPRIVKER